MWFCSCWHCTQLPHHKNQMLFKYQRPWQRGFLFKLSIPHDSLLKEKVEHESLQINKQNWTKPKLNKIQKNPCFYSKKDKTHWLKVLRGGHLKQQFSSRKKYVSLFLLHTLTHQHICKKKKKSYNSWLVLIFHRTVKKRCTWISKMLQV